MNEGERKNSHPACAVQGSWSKVHDTAPTQTDVVSTRPTHDGAMRPFFGHWCTMVDVDGRRALSLKTTGRKAWKFDSPSLRL